MELKFNSVIFPPHGHFPNSSGKVLGGVLWSLSHSKLGLGARQRSGLGARQG